MWKLERAKGIPVYQSIVELIMTHIKQGRLLPGEKIPPERQLAKFLGVNRSTVVHALDELESIGVIIRKQGSGTTVNDGKWGVYTGATTNWRSYLAQDPFTYSDPYLEKLVALSNHSDEQIIDAYTGELPLDLIPAIDLPNITWKDFLIEETHQDELGYLPLREQLVGRLNQGYELAITADQLLLTSGAQQALFLIIQVLLKSGDAVAIEEPSFFYPLSIFQAAGIRLYGVPVDEDGMNIEILEKQIIHHKIKMVLVNPNFQNPTGTNMSYERRKQLIELCQQYQVPIVEDDVFSQLYFDEADKPVLLKEMDEENVIYIGSLSKILGATTKIGWLSAPVKVTERLAEARREMDFTLSIFPQVLASSAMSNPEFEVTLQTLRKELKIRRDCLLKLVREHLEDEVIVTKPTGGYYLWLTSRHKKLGRKDFEWLLEKKVLIMPGFLFGVDYQSFRINFARLNRRDGLVIVKKIKEMFARLSE